MMYNNYVIPQQPGVLMNKIFSNNTKCKNE